MLKTLLALSATMMATTSFAHQLWIEQAPELEATHMDRTPGERPGTQANGTIAPERFDRVHHVTTLSVLKVEGLSPLPATPAAGVSH